MHHLSGSMHLEFAREAFIKLSINVIEKTITKMSIYMEHGREILFHPNWIPSHCFL